MIFALGCMLQVINDATARQDLTKRPESRSRSDWRHSEGKRFLASRNRRIFVRITFNTVNQITNSGYTYDNNGNLTADLSRTYEWDAADRLVAINNIAIGGRTEFTYDGLSRRVKIVEKYPGASGLFH
jgi:YD repeat-containing protein